MTQIEQADLIRGLLSHRGWTEVFEVATRDKLDQVKNQLVLNPDERMPEYRTWDTQRLGGFVLGVSWAQKALAIWLKHYNDSIAQAEAEAAAEIEPRGHGNPYAAEGVPEGADAR